jgi:RNase H-fold protein (predicted Holliday junction resolvase)
MFQTENRRLQQELVDAIKEKDRIQKMWMDEREESLKIREILKELQSEKEFLSVNQLY